MGYNLLINGVYWGCNPLTNHLLTSWDIQVWQDFSRFWHLQEALLVDETTWVIPLTYRLSYGSSYKIKHEWTPFNKKSWHKRLQSFHTFPFSILPRYLFLCPFLSLVFLFTCDDPERNKPLFTPRRFRGPTDVYPRHSMDGMLFTYRIQDWFPCSNSGACFFWIIQVLTDSCWLFFFMDKCKYTMHTLSIWVYVGNKALRISWVLVPKFPFFPEKRMMIYLSGTLVLVWKKLVFF